MNILDAENYEPLFPDGHEDEDQAARVQCKCCRANSLWGELRHTAWCEWFPKQTVNVESLGSVTEPTEAPAEATTTQRTVNARDLARAARRGDARLYYSDDEIFEETKYGLSWSDAMNQDF